MFKSQGYIMNNKLSNEITIRTVTGATANYYGATGGTTVDVKVFASSKQLSMDQVLRLGFDAEFVYYEFVMSFIDVAKNATIVFNSKTMTIKSVLHDDKSLKTKVIACYAG